MAKRSAVSKRAGDASESPWDAACAVGMRIGGQVIDPGVVFFVMALQEMGATTHYSCEGHPLGFYVCFEGPESLARSVRSCGVLRVEVEHVGWSIRLNEQTSKCRRFDDSERKMLLRWAAGAWAGNLPIRETLSRIGRTHSAASTEEDGRTTAPQDGQQARGLAV